MNKMPESDDIERGVDVAKEWARVQFDTVPHPNRRDEEREIERERMIHCKSPR